MKTQPHHEHTKTPWILTNNENGKFVHIVDNTGENPSIAIAENETNAKHIIKCVNAYDILVQSLRHLEKYHINCDVRFIAKQALKQAKIEF
jgi:3-deoxy-D-arabino-heptulosonate 7-phosphate (DAHP) synthase class II